MGLEAPFDLILEVSSHEFVLRPRIVKRRGHYHLFYKLVYTNMVEEQPSRVNAMSPSSWAISSVHKLFTEAMERNGIHHVYLRSDPAAGMSQHSNDLLSAIENGLVVSVQATDGSPLRNSVVLAALAAAALRGGAVGLRVNGPEDIRAIRQHATVPIIGLHKVDNGRRRVITPELHLAADLAAAGADIIAIDATEEVLGTDFSFLTRVMDEVSRPVMADISTHTEGMRAWDAGVAVVGTTLSGYTPQSSGMPETPDLALVESLANAGVRVIAEGRYRTPAQLASAFDAGAFAVVVGGAITDATAITSAFVRAIPQDRLPNA